MSKHNFAIDSHIRLDDQLCVIRRQLNHDQFVLENLQNGSMTTHAGSELRIAYGDGKLSFCSFAPSMDTSDEGKGRKLKTLFAELPDHHQSEARHRKCMVEAFRAASPEAKLLPREHRPPFLRDAMTRALTTDGPRRAPSLSTVNRWAKAYSSADEDIHSLVPRHESRGNRTPRIAQEVQDIALKVINEHFLTRQRIPLKVALEQIHVEINAYNRRDSTIVRLVKPGRKVLRRLLAAMDRYEIVRRRHGKDRANAEFRRALESGEVLTEPLQRVEIDHTLLDVIVVDEVTWLPVGRPWLTVALDRKTRCILGYYLGFEPPSYLSVMQCLVRAFSPKDYLRAKYDDIRNEWPCWGIPDLLVLDNGREFHSDHLKAAALEVGFDLRYNVVKEAWGKGAIERWFRTVEKGLIHQMPGTTFSSIADRGDYKSEKMAAISLANLDHLLSRWIVDVYHCTPHRSMLTTPLAAWRDTIDPAKQKLPDSVKSLQVTMGSSRPGAHVFHYGVTVNNLNYNSRELQDLKAQSGTKLRVTVKWNSSDLGIAHVLDEETNSYLDVPCTWFSYASGLSLWQHKLIRRIAAERFSDDDQKNLLDAKQALREMVENAMKSKRLSTRKKAARARNADPKPEVQPKQSLPPRTPAVDNGDAPTPSPGKSSPTDEDDDDDITPFETL